MDIDSVLGDFGKHFLDYLDIPDKTPAKEWNDPRFRDNFHRVRDDWRFWLTMPTLTPPSDIKFLYDYYFTARTVPSWVSKVWLDRNDYLDVPVHTVGHDGSKVDIMKSLNVTLMLDDAIHNFEELNDNGITCFMFTRPHNESYKTEMRCDSMADFAGKVAHFETVNSTII